MIRAHHFPSLVCAFWKQDLAFPRLKKTISMASGPRKVVLTSLSFLSFLVMFEFAGVLLVDLQAAVP